MDDLDLLLRITRIRHVIRLHRADCTRAGQRDIYACEMGERGAPSGTQVRLVGEAWGPCFVMSTDRRDETRDG